MNNILRAFNDTTEPKNLSNAPDSKAQQTLRSIVLGLSLLFAQGGEVAAQEPNNVEQTVQNTDPKKPNWQEWENSEEFKAVLAAIQSEFPKLNSEKFEERQNAQIMLEILCENIVRRCNPPPPAVKALLWPWKREEKPAQARREWKDGIKNFEAVMRREAAIKKFGHMQESLPSAFLPDIYEVPVILQELQERTGFSIDLSASEDPTGLYVDIREGQNDIASVLNEIGRLLRAKPHFEGNERIVFTSSDDHMHRASFIGNRLVLALQERSAESPQKRDIHIRCLPRKGIIADIVQAKSKDESLSQISAGEPPHIIPEWFMHNGHSTPSFSRSISRTTSESAVSSNDLLTNVTLVRKPKSLTLKPGEFGNIGVQAINISEGFALEKKWRLCVQISLLNQIPWQVTLSAIDSQTYALASFNRYDMKNADGKALKWNIFSCCAMNRKIYLECDCEERPEEIGITGFTEVEEGDTTSSLVLPPIEPSIGIQQNTVRPLPLRPQRSKNKPRLLFVP